MGTFRLDHTYRLVLADGAEGLEQVMEFSAPSPEAALYLAQRHCAGREVELFEDERSLGRLRCVPHAGFWLLSSREMRAQR